MKFKITKQLSSAVIFTVLLALALSFANNKVMAVDDLPEIKVGCEEDFSPYAFVDARGQAAGFSVDLIKAVAKKAGPESVKVFLTITSSLIFTF